MGFVPQPNLQSTPHTPHPTATPACVGRVKGGWRGTNSRPCGHADCKSEMHEICRGDSRIAPTAIRSIWERVWAGESA
ncbi:MAG: hypothetical protein F6J93_13335 [Oscillatoria sp. SIO1A7]|nr:hypothetical protein [Oscillatoria sp. SIO1A7]